LSALFVSLLFIPNFYSEAFVSSADPRKRRWGLHCGIGIRLGLPES
jgi:hypothetical protein